MDAVGCSEASVTIYHTTRYHTQEDSIFQRYYPEAFEAHILKLFHVNCRCIGRYVWLIASYESVGKAPLDEGGSGSRAGPFTAFRSVSCTHWMKWMFPIFCLNAVEEVEISAFSGNRTPVLQPVSITGNREVTEGM